MAIGTRIREVLTEEVVGFALAHSVRDGGVVGGIDGDECRGGIATTCCIKSCYGKITRSAHRDGGISAARVPLVALRSVGRERGGAALTGGSVAADSNHGQRVDRYIGEGAGRAALRVGDGNGVEAGRAHRNGSSGGIVAPAVRHAAVGRKCGGFALTDGSVAADGGYRLRVDAHVGVGRSGAAVRQRNGYGVVARIADGDERRLRPRAPQVVALHLHRKRGAFALADVGVAADGHARQGGDLHRRSVGAAVGIRYQYREVAGMVGGDAAGSLACAPEVAAALGGGKLRPDAATDDGIARDLHGGQRILHHGYRTAAGAAAHRGAGNGVGAGLADGDGGGGDSRTPRIAGAARSRKGGAAARTEGRLARNDRAAEYTHPHTLGGAAVVAIGEGADVGAALANGDGGRGSARVPVVAVGARCGERGAFAFAEGGIAADGADGQRIDGDGGVSRSRTAVAIGYGNGIGTRRSSGDGSRSVLGAPQIGECIRQRGSSCCSKRGRVSRANAG